jgi:hypothetical protein
MDNVSIYNRGILLETVNKTRFETDILDFMIEHEWHEIYLDEDNEFICRYGDEMYNLERFIAGSSKVLTWLDLHERYIDGER